MFRRISASMLNILVKNAEGKITLVSPSAGLLKDYPNLQKTFQSLQDSSLDPSVADHTETHAKTPEFGESHSKTTDKIATPLDLTSDVLIDTEDLPSILSMIEKKLSDMDKVVHTPLDDPNDPAVNPIEDHR